MVWSAGDQIALRYVGDWGGDNVTWVTPVTVVQDDADCIAVFLAAGTPLIGPARKDGSEIPRALPFEQRFNMATSNLDSVWHTNSRLMIARRGAAHLCSYFWIAKEWTPLGWYVDLQAPFRRTPIGFDSQDYVLDLLVKDDLSWSWKDEDEFADAIRIGHFTLQQAAAIRAEGERVIEVIEAGGWPFNAGWESWRPDPGWPIPTVPDNWDQV